MGILCAPRKDTQITLVYSEDDAVDIAPKSPRGWIEKGTARAVRDGATVVKVSPLCADDDSRCADSGGIVSQALARVRAGLRSVNGDSDDEAREDFVERCPRDPRFLLGVAIRALTDCEDIHAGQKVLFRSRPSEVADGEESEAEGGSEEGGGEVEG